MSEDTPLNRWMEAQGKTDQWLASELGCDRTQASRIRRNRSRPSAARAFQIEKLTRGRVKAADLLTAIPANDATPSERAA